MICRRQARLKAEELCESRGGLPGLPSLISEATLQQQPRVAWSQWNYVSVVFGGCRHGQVLCVMSVWFDGACFALVSSVCVCVWGGWCRGACSHACVCARAHISFSNTVVTNGNYFMVDLCVACSNAAGHWLQVMATWCNARDLSTNQGANISQPITCRGNAPVRIVHALTFPWPFRPLWLRECVWHEWWQLYYRYDCELTFGQPVNLQQQQQQRKAKRTKASPCMNKIKDSVKSARTDCIGRFFCLLWISNITVMVNSYIYC